MSAYKRTIILHVLLAFLGLFMILRAEELSDTPIAFQLIGAFCILIALSKIALIRWAMKEDMNDKEDQ